MYKLGYEDTLRQFGLLEKRALLGRILGLLKYPYGKERERAVRYYIAKRVAPLVSRTADRGARALNQVVSFGTAGRVPSVLDPETRLRIMRFTGEHPLSLAGASAGLVLPAPGMADVGMLGGGLLSKGVKRLTHIPTKGDITLRELGRVSRERGYSSLMDEMIRTGEKKTPAEFVPEARKVLRDLASSPRGVT
jgi:hypothetical protein